MPEISHLHGTHRNHIRTFHATLPLQPFVMLRKHMTTSTESTAKSSSNGKCAILKTSSSTINTFFTDPDYKPLISSNFTARATV